MFIYVTVTIDDKLQTTKRREQSAVVITIQGSC